MFAIFSGGEVVNETNDSEPQESTVIEIVDEKTLTLKSGEIKTITSDSPEKKGFEKFELVYDGEKYASLVYNPIDRTESEEILKEEDENKTLDDEEDEPLDTNETIEENITIEVNGENETIKVSVKTCENLNGTICLVDEERCEGEQKYTQSSVCCIGECVKIEENNNKKVVGWTIIAAIGLFLIWFFKKKYRGAKPEIPNLLKIGKK